MFLKLVPEIRKWKMVSCHMHSLQIMDGPPSRRLVLAHLYYFEISPFLEAPSANREK